jgi:hypothetical protein
MMPNKIVVPAGVWVSIAGLYKPGKIIYSQNTNQATVVLESIAESERTFRNPKPTLTVLRRSAATELDLKENLIREFGSKVSFSHSNPQPGSDPAIDAKAALAQLREDREPTSQEIAAAKLAIERKYLSRRGDSPAVEVTWEMCQAVPRIQQDGRVVSIRRKVFDAIVAEREQESIDSQIAQHRAISLQVPEDQLEGLRQRNIHLLKTESSLAPAFVNKAFFFDWPDSSGYNREQLYDYCQGHGYWPIPLVRELEEACRYLDGHKHFAESTYKRSQQHLKPKPYNREDLDVANTRLPLSELEAAKTKLRLFYGDGAEITLEKALRAGVSEKAFYGLNSEMRTTKDRANTDFASLQREVRAGFKQPPPQ